MNGDNEAFDELALSIKNYLYSKARTKLYNEQDIEDAVQSTLYIAYKEIASLHSPHAFKAWITTILYNQCYEICKDDIKQKKVIQKLSKYSRVTETEFDIDEFDTLIKGLNDKEKEILDLLYRKNLTYKEIAKELNINISTLKYYNTTRLDKLRELLKKRTVIIFILCFFIIGVVVSAVTIISYLKNAISTEDVGVNNDGVLMAIENLDWYQKVDMDYQDLGDGYKIKMDYLLMDEMCLYMIFDLESLKDVSKYTDVSLPDLRIIDENGNVICDKSDVKAPQFAQRFGCKLIENDKEHLKFLVYMYAEEFPISKTLDIEFSTVLLTKRNILSTNEDRLTTNISLSINLLDKFINRSHTNYTSNSNILKKAIVTETGFYLTLAGENLDNMQVSLMDENNLSYDCYLLSFTNSNSLVYMVVSSFNNVHINRLTLDLSNKSLELEIAN